MPALFQDTFDFGAFLDRLEQALLQPDDAAALQLQQQQGGDDGAAAAAPPDGSGDGEQDVRLRHGDDDGDDDDRHSQMADAGHASGSDDGGDDDVAQARREEEEEEIGGDSNVYLSPGGQMYVKQSSPLIPREARDAIAAAKRGSSPDSRSRRVHPPRGESAARAAGGRDGSSRSYAPAVQQHGALGNELVYVPSAGGAAAPSATPEAATLASPMHRSGGAEHQGRHGNLAAEEDDLPASAADSVRNVAGYRTKGRRPRTEDEVREALSLAERQMVYGETQKERTEALFWAGELREQLARLLRLNRGMRKVRSAHAYADRRQGVDEHGLRHHPPQSSQLGGSRQHRRAAAPATDGGAVDSVTWRPASSRPAPLKHPAGWQSVGGYDDAEDVAVAIAAVGLGYKQEYVGKVKAHPLSEYHQMVGRQKALQKAAVQHHRKLWYEPYE